MLNGGPRKISPFFIPAAIVNLAAGQVSIRYGAKGPNEATATACTTSAHSIGDAYRIIQRGDADAMIAGGAEAAITPMGIGGFAAMKALSTRNDDPEHACRPFDKDRDGFIVGEGAGILILEELEHAKARGAKILGEIVGYGMSSDAYHMTGMAAEGEGCFRAMTNAMKSAEISPDQIGYVNAHATSTPLGDALESAAMKKLFGERALKGERAGELDEIDDRASAGRRRRTGSGHHGDGDDRTDRSADNESCQSGPGVRAALRTEQAGEDQHRVCAVELVWFWRNEWVADLPAVGGIAASLASTPGTGRWGP